MAHDFNKPPHKTNELERSEKKRIPVLILIVVGIFLAALIFYMLSDKAPKAGEVPADTSIPATQADTATATDSSVSNTATAIAEDTAKANSTNQ